MTLTDRYGHTLDAEAMIGFYGVGTTEYDDETGEAFSVFRRGLLSEHVEHFVAAGGRVHTAASGMRWAYVGTAAAAPVVCSEIIPIVTEDGPSDGRCGLDAVAEPGMCRGHAAEYRAFCAA